jgi:hypothetical protein
MKSKKRVKTTIKQEPTPTEFKIVGQPDVIRGVYSNIALIQHTQNEFILDFLLRLAGEAQLVSRIILSPQHAMALLNALGINVNKYEDNFGKIKANVKKEILKPS